MVEIAFKESYYRKPHKLSLEEEAYLHRETYVMALTQEMVGEAVSQG